jgi:membrane-anchored protein YejM (alkaline phosphatase superfamily)
MQTEGAISVAFIASLFIVYSFLYIIPSLLLSVLTAVVFIKIPLRDQIKKYIVYSFMNSFAFLTVILLLIDWKIFSMFKFHINGFVINLVLTPGGIESMGASNTDNVILIIIAILIYLSMWGLLAFSRWSLKKYQFTTKKVVTTSIFLLVSIAVIFTFQITTFAYAFYKNDSVVLSNARAIPLFRTITMRHIFESLDVKPGKPDLALAPCKHNALLNYPLNPIVLKPRAKRMNLIFLVAESWRWDTINSELMPATAEFTKTALYFRQHYSSGNGTQEALFGCFYGLYGSYWQTFLSTNESPVFINALKKQNYQFDMRTSAKFTYPEFDKTIFSAIDKKNMFQANGRGGFVEDRLNIDSMFNFIKHRDKNRPFMTFMFFESPHAPYTFPKECEVKKDYLKDFNYTAAITQGNIGKIKNRYLNAVNHLDTQLARVYQFMKQQNLMNNTILVVTGDHGEEFMEKGHWGHNESFHTEQIRPPLLIYIPGVEPKEVNDLSSHLDIIPTLAPWFGIKNSPEDFSLGYNLLGSKKRTFTVISSWNKICYLDDRLKYVTSLRNRSILVPDEQFTPDDKPLSTEEKSKVKIRDVMEMKKGMVKFYK